MNNDKRNWKIYLEWIEGKDYRTLAVEYNLSADTIKNICTEKVPPTIRTQSWQTANQYYKYRQWMKRQRDKYKSKV